MKWKKNIWFSTPMILLVALSIMGSLTIGVHGYLRNPQVYATPSEAFIDEPVTIDVNITVVEC